MDIKAYDVIIGYRADDSYFSFAQDFVANVISFRQLDEAMHLGKLGEQIVLKSKKAFDRITFMDSIPAQKEEYFAKKMMHDMEARKAYRNRKRQLAEESGVPIRQIQLFEQRRRDINKTQLETAWKLARALACRIEDLAEVRLW